MGPPLRTGEREAKHGVETSVVPCSQEVQTTTALQETDANFLWDMGGPILVKFQEHGETVNNAKYSTLLQDQLKPAVCHKRWALLSKEVIMHGRIQQQQWYRLYNDLDLNCFRIPLTVLI
jgi:hypothetical protein